MAMTAENRMFVDMLISDGRRYAQQARTEPLPLVGDNLGHAASIERYLTKFLQLFSPAGRDNAAQWANAVIWGHDMLAITPGPTPAAVFDAALTAAGVHLDRQTWAAGLTHSEAIAVSQALQLPAPDPLIDIDQRRDEAHQAWRDELIARGEDPDDW